MAIFRVYAGSMGVGSGTGPSVRATPGLVMEDCGVPNGSEYQMGAGQEKGRSTTSARHTNKMKPTTVAHKTLPQLESLSKYVQYTY